MSCQSNKHQKTYKCPCLERCPDHKKDACQIESDYVNMYYALYMKEYWGITTGYKVVDPLVATQKIYLLNWQLESDCGSLCQ